MIPHSFRLRPVVLLVGLGISWLFAPDLQAQNEPLKFRFLVEPQQVIRDLDVFELRPNTGTAIGIHLKNPRNEAVKNLTVQLVKVLGDKVEVVGAAKIASLAALQETPLNFPKGKEPGIELSGPPFQFQLWLEEGTKPMVKIPFDVKIKSPQEYIETPVANYDKERRRLSVRLQLKPDLTGPPSCPAQLVVSPKLIPGIKEPKLGTFKQILQPGIGQVELFAENLEFEPELLKTTTEGRIYVTVDGFERAFVFRVNADTFNQGGELTLLTFNNRFGARTFLPRYTQPQAKFPAAFEIDGPLNAGRLVVGLNRTGNKLQFQEQTFPGLRQQKVAAFINEQGSLVLKTTVQDWTTYLDTADVFGNIWIRAGVLRGWQGNTEQDLNDLEPEVIPLFAKGGYRLFAPLHYDLFHKPADQAREVPRAILAGVILDGTAPENVHFVNLPKEWIRGKDMILEAACDPRDLLKQAPIDRAVFFLGRPPADGKIPPEAILGDGAYDQAKELWRLPIPVPEKAEKLDVSVVFTTLAGLSASTTGTVRLRDPEKLAAKEKAKAAKVWGLITHGDRAQPNVPVYLYDAKGEVKGSMRTNGLGQYLFEKVPPGAYTVYALKATPALSGVSRVEVKEGDAEVITNFGLKAK